MGILQKFAFSGGASLLCFRFSMHSLIPEWPLSCGHHPLDRRNPNQHASPWVSQSKYCGPAMSRGRMLLMNYAASPSKGGVGTPLQTQQSWHNYIMLQIWYDMKRLFVQEYHWEQRMHRRYIFLDLAHHQRWILPYRITKLFLQYI